jgi:polysaccharide chain length determinant protein (PEP-CTERM system associated)
MNSDLKYYVAIFMRRLPAFLVVALGLSALAVSLAMKLPTVYSATAQLLVESPQIPNDLASSTVSVNATEQLQIVQKRLMTRANLIDIAAKFDAYTSVDNLSPDQIVNLMRNDTVFKANSGRDQATLLAITFSARTPQISANVVNELVTRILDENIRQRTGRAEDTQEFFKREVERLGTELNIIGQKIVDFQNSNSDALPDSLNFRLTQQSALQERLAQSARDSSALLEQRARMVELFNTTGSVGEMADTPKSPEEVQLAAAVEQLNQTLTVYSESNPRVKVIRARIAQLEAAVLSNAGLSTDSNGESATVLDVQLAGIDSQLATLTAQKTQIESELKVLSDSISRTPANAIALGSLERDYNNTKDQYNEAVLSLSKAATGERIELLSKGQRITVIEQAVPPSEPKSPNRPLIAGGGTVGAIGAAFGLVALLELLNRTIRRPVDLSKKLGITPLGAIPFMRTRKQVVRNRSVFGILAIVFFAALIACALYVHFRVMPLDLVVNRALKSLNLR